MDYITASVVEIIAIYGPFCTAEETVNKMRRQPTRGGGDIFASDTSDKGLMSRIDKALTKLNINQRNLRIFKRGVSSLISHENSHLRSHARAILSTFWEKKKKFNSFNTRTYNQKSIVPKKEVQITETQLLIH